MKKVKISEEDIKVLINKQGQKSKKIKYEIGDKEIVINVNPVISFTERVNLVESAINVVFNEGINIENYLPACREFAIRWAIVDKFTDFTLPTKIDDVWLVLSQTKIYDDVCEVVGNDINAIIGEIDEGIKAKRDYLVRKTDIASIIEKFSNGINDIGNKLNPNDITKLLDILGKMPDKSGESMVKAILENSKTEQKEENSDK